ncbi:MAG: ribonuclease E/G [Lachnospiraceae bacterium]|nr:ribonuclease E/G [Lachnospiraceae bacterium]
MSKRLVITRLGLFENRIFSGLFDDHSLLDLSCTPDNKDAITVGDIYVAKVKQVNNSIDACFVDIIPGFSSYLPFKEIVNPVFVKKQSEKKLISEEDEIIVQVTREPSGVKRASVSTDINITGSFCFVSSGNTVLGVSKKIGKKKESLFKEHFKDLKPDEFGLVIRTNAANTEMETVEEEAKSLFTELKKLLSTGVHKNCYSCLKKGLKPYIKDAVGLNTADTECIVTDCEDIFKDLLSAGFEKERITLYKDDYSLDNLYSFSNQVKRALDNKVFLKSGGFLVIEKTEALWVVDVNSGKTDKKTDKSKSVMTVNKEAALEISKQFKLRAMSGIIIIDFIDMESKEDEEQLTLYMKELLKEDSTAGVVYGMTSLGLMEISRKKTKKPLLEVISAQ